MTSAEGLYDDLAVGKWLKLMTVMKAKQERWEEEVINCPGIDWVSLKAPADGSHDAQIKKNFAVTQGLSQIGA